MTLVADPKDPAKAVPDSTRPDTSGPESRGWFREFVLRLHFYAGILAGPFLLVAALTGGLYAITPQLEQAVYAKELHVPAVTQPQPLSAQVQSAMDAVGGASPVAVRPAPGPEDTTRVLFADPSLGASENRTIFVDPGTTAIRRDLTTYGSSGALPMRTWISNLHRSLNLGEPGRIYSELAATWLGVVALGGLVLGIGRLRRRGNTPKKARPASGRQRLLWLHGTTGTVLLAGFLFLSASGLTWSANAGNNINAVRASLGWLTATVSTSLTGQPTAPGGDHSGHGTGQTPEAGAADPVLYDTVERLAREDIVTAPMVAIKPPAVAGTAWTVTEIGREWPATASAVAIDPASGQVTSRADFEDFGLAAKLTNWAIAAHMGLLLAWPTSSSCSPSPAGWPPWSSGAT
jgi:uncharacterized iron-regulated membrane protein